MKKIMIILFLPLMLSLTSFSMDQAKKNLTGQQGIKELQKEFTSLKTQWNDAQTLEMQQKKLSNHFKNEKQDFCYLASAKISQDITKEKKDLSKKIETFTQKIENTQVLDDTFVTQVKTLHAETLLPIENPVTSPKPKKASSISKGSSLAGLLRTLSLKEIRKQTDA